VCCSTPTRSETQTSPAPSRLFGKELDVDMVYDTDSIGLLTHLGVGLEVDLRYDPDSIGLLPLVGVKLNFDALYDTDSIGIVTGSRCGVRC